MFRLIAWVTVLLGVVKAEITFVRDEASLARFVSAHPVHRLVRFDENDHNSLRALRDIPVDDLVPTAAVLASTRGAFPRTTMRRQLAPSNLFAFGAGDVRGSDHWLALLGAHEGQRAITALAEAAAASPSTMFVYAKSSDRRAAVLFQHFGFHTAANMHEMHHIDAAGTIVSSFRFTDPSQLTEGLLGNA